MTLSAVLAVVVGILGRAGIPYMVTGSLASTFHGEPRATRDLDIVIDPDDVSLGRLVADLQQQNYDVDSDAAFTALQERGQFNAIGPDGWKVDFMIRRDRPFSIEEFGRGRPVGVCEDAPASFGRDVVVARARSRLGENAYRILSNNCEHFCEWCLHGTSRSPQVEKWLGRPTRALLALMRRLVHIQPGAARGNAAGVSA